RAQVIPCPESVAATIETVGNGPGSFAFSPNTATIQAGQVVRFLNETDIGHTSTSGTGSDNPGVPDGIWDTGNLAKNTPKCVRINVPGSYPFYCTPHPEAMTGTITVE
ncbi:MAG TPA: plastocyanin/azurin family copper-binding protein, partial [Polyangiaceae bacterium]